jgi:glycosyltransferase involved in cell wall biosynthesis
VNVLHLYSGNLYGGIETLLVTLARERSRCPSMQPQFALCFEGRLASELQQTEAQVHVLGEVRVSRPWTVWSARQQLSQLLTQQHIDVVVCHACWTQAIFAPVVRSHSIPLVFWCHDTPTGQHWLERWAKHVKPDLAIANSRYTLNALPTLYRHVAGQVFYYPVLAPEITQQSFVRQAVRAELGTSDDTVVIIQTSRMEQWKGHLLLFSALVKLRDNPAWVCWIAGGAQRPHEAEYLQTLQSKVQEWAIADRVQFLGQRSDIPQLLAAADIHCQPNLEPEPFGIAFIEALYAGLPVVTTAQGAAVEIITGHCGRLTTPGDVEHLSQTLNTLLTQPAERLRLGEAGRLRAVELCDPTRQLVRLYHLFTQLVQREVAA